MADIESLYRKEGDVVLIGIQLSSVLQLFNSYDPAPFHEKELDTAAENYIVDTVRDFPKKARFKIVFYLPQELTETERAQHIPEAVRNHFAYRVMVQDRKFRERFRHGRWALLIGLTFLAIALFARQAIPPHIGSQLVAQIFADALLIIGWAAMWEPITILLYELWPMIRQKQVYERISTMPIEIRPRP